MLRVECAQFRDRFHQPLFGSEDQLAHTGRFVIGTLDPLLEGEKVVDRFFCCHLPLRDLRSLPGLPTHQAPSSDQSNQDQSPNPATLAIKAFPKNRVSTMGVENADPLEGGRVPPTRFLKGLGIVTPQSQQGLNDGTRFFTERLTVKIRFVFHMV